MSLAVSIWTRGLRLIASAATLTAAMVMRSSHDTNDDNDFQIDFGDLTPYRCFVSTNLIVFSYSLIAAFLPNKSMLWRLIVALDAILVVVLSSSCSAAMAVTCLEKNGSLHAKWDPICQYVPTYCNHNLGAIATCYFGVLVMFLLHLISIQAAIDPLLIMDQL